MKDLTPEEAGRWMEAAPELVQQAVTSPATERVITELGTKYNLHVDVVGQLLKLTSYMLLGYAGPEQSVSELKAAGVSEQNASKIIVDINQKIFMPLREEMEHGGGEAKAPAPVAQRPVETPAPMVSVPRYVPPTPPPPPPQVVRPEPVAPSFPPPQAREDSARSYIPEYPAGTYAPPPQSPRYPNQESDNMSAYLRRAEPTPPHHMVNKIPAPPAVARPASPTPPPVRPAQPALEQSDRLLEDHEEAHIEFNRPTVRLVVPPLTTARPASTPPGWVPPNLPGVVHVPPVLEVKPSLIVPKEAMPKPPAAAPVTPPAPPTPVAPPRPYSVDPYREPFDESSERGAGAQPSR